MCGIYGILGKTSILEVINSLEKLEYRGYDSCGIAYLYKNTPFLKKTVGNTSNLKAMIENKDIEIAIGHTRWATHGIVNSINAHPHSSKNKRFYIAHNGVIDNYLELKAKYSFKHETDTDSEVICHLLDLFSINNSILDAIKLIKNEIKGSYAIVIMDTLDSNKIYYMKNKSPLLLAEGLNNIVVASDQTVFNDKMRVIVLNDGNYGYISLDGYKICSNKKDEKWNTFNKDSSYSIKKVNQFYMEDEIQYEPYMIETISKFYKSINITDFTNEMNNSAEIVFVGAGSSYYAGCILKDLYEKKLKKRCYCVVASELKYFNCLSHNTLFIFLSQSGETADLCDGLLYIKNKGYKIISLCNNVNSTLGYNSDMIFPLMANAEISVASTKAFTAMIYVGCVLLDSKLYLYKGDIISKDLKGTLHKYDKIIDICNDISSASHIFYLGKGLDYSLALEASLKLREISYLSCFAFYSGELKHGSIALIDSETVSIGILSDISERKMIISGLEEIKSRGGRAYLISNVDKTADLYVEGDIFSLIMIFQMIAYKTALMLNRNVDQPRNLAKSVTVL